MAQYGEEYMTTAQVARELHLSVATVQHLVADGQLNAIRTQGGHRRIYIDSVTNYKERHGYRTSSSAVNNIFILHQGLELDITVLKEIGSATVKLISHPLDLLGLETDSAVFFFDACNLWLQTTPVALIRSLQKTHTVYIYNSEKLSKNGQLNDFNLAYLIPAPISTEFLAGYLTGRELQKRA